MATGLANAGAFTTLAVACVTTYVVAVSRDPGHMMSSFMPDVEDTGSPILIHEITRKVLTTPVPPLRLDHGLLQISRAPPWCCEVQGAVGKACGVGEDRGGHGSGAGRAGQCCTHSG
ncbi:unnamed protein product [Urochloa humidicola]